jgi:hypothetical protein
MPTTLRGGVAKDPPTTEREIMKRILIAAGLIAASQTAWAGPISDWVDACHAKVLANAQRCIDAAPTQEGETLCKILGHDSIHTCDAAAQAAINANPENW